MRTLMIQGTASNSGKSLIVAALCRMLTRKGYRVAPFKAHNLSDKSYTTAQGKIIGSAQYIQAYGCGATVSELLNPVLISLAGSQTRFIINGEVVHTGPFSDYSRLVPRMKEAITGSLHTLQE
ncbi:MAG: AAA family ATPase [Bacteroides sp.]|nr:AAA family ATPase [Bacteroides sp.]